MFFSYLHSMSKMMKFWPIYFKSHSSYHSKFIKHLLLIISLFRLKLLWALVAELSPRRRRPALSPWCTYRWPGS